ncbi:2-oxoacid:acceptor oxidoreductase subunit alpha [Desulfofundulus salinus]|uniref:2-oxoacid:acceptor oxidoreductase subunit alpha n=1 Tax=Desulfofundulus salinus TaxID=2419843 RepID=A0A494WVL3_9FIRM|nr:2-oxoacid:acceptor oxidoreductase subunit alpha [Desulfofundulus salinum]RKO67528.1 2-oxoacid:acceptor oxidoreductase subunit alpha [Desulfofundulus salinum]
MKGKVEFIQGNIACAKGALAAGCRFFAGYPITPSTEIAEFMSRELPKVGGYYVQMEDEIGSMASLIGASYTGLKVMTATSGPGFTLMQENLGNAVMEEAPCVIVNVQRGGPAIGQATKSSQSDIMQSRWGSHGDYEIIALAPYSGQEMFDLTIRAFNLAEKYRVPVIVLSDEILGHAREKVIIRDQEEIKIINRKKPLLPPGEYKTFQPDDDMIPPMASLGEGYRILVEPQTHDETGRRAAHIPEAHDKLIRRLCAKINNNVEDIAEIDARFMEDAEAAIVSYGSAARSSLGAVKQARNQGIKLGYIRLKTIWPFHEAYIRNLARNLKALFVVENNLGQMYLEVQRACRDLVDDIISITKIGGEMHSIDEILRPVKEVIS